MSLEENYKNIWERRDCVLNPKLGIWYGIAEGQGRLPGLNFEELEAVV